MNLRNDIGARKYQYIIIAGKAHPVRSELPTTKILLRQAVALNHRSHGAIQQQYALREYLLQALHL